MDIHTAKPRFLACLGRRWAPYRTVRVVTGPHRQKGRAWRYVRYDATRDGKFGKLGLRETGAKPLWAVAWHASRMRTSTTTRRQKKKKKKPRDAAFRSSHPFLLFRLIIIIISTSSAVITTSPRRPSPPPPPQPPPYHSLCLDFTADQRLVCSFLCLLSSCKLLFVSPSRPTTRFNLPALLSTTTTSIPPGYNRSASSSTDHRTLITFIYLYSIAVSLAAGWISSRLPPANHRTSSQIARAWRNSS